MRLKTWREVILVALGGVLALAVALVAGLWVLGCVGVAMLLTAAVSAWWLSGRSLL